MYLKLSLVLPSIVIVLLGRPFQGFINLVLFFKCNLLIGFCKFRARFSPIFIKRYSLHDIGIYRKKVKIYDFI